MRIGIGYDIHPFAGGRSLILGGVDIPHPQGLAGHSDADALAHAVADAVLGALGLGDIGRHFPDTDPAWAGADSIGLLARVADHMQQAGYRIGNVDAVIIAQAPKMAPHVAAMQNNLAQTLGCAPEQVNVKATTHERLGTLGRGEGIAVQAVCLLTEK
ncbi:MAG: 2-C-methyl-D-erythritol 2,4-cyclodiphosphate synthase [Nitrospirota bacterium]|nr:2-C-methyl-D-erythritol 2,4-cyclodiphosphate synthase [Nitrospirota bacterium]